jgi:7 transmembrane helices usually fused to an inactive transglutaminase/Transglutaminase-like superfamily
VECLKAGSGTAAGKSRLLVALCRSRGIPARLVNGLTLRKLNDLTMHTWVEAWIGDHWVPMCPFNHYCGRVPSSYLIFGFGDMVMVRGHNVHNLDYSCLVEPRSPPEPTASPSFLQRVFARLSLFALPPAEHQLVEFLLLLPLAALIICIFRNLIGIASFGTFAPALVGLAFREIESLPGILVFVSIILIGWSMRRILDRYHLLQVPRTAFLLSLVVLVLIAAVVAANFRDFPATRYFSLFPMVILTGMIERFWTLETEDGTASSFKTLLSTMLIAATISVVLSVHAIAHHMVRYPETLGVIMAVQLLIGRYTGYRLLELFRFRDFVTPPPGEGRGAMGEGRGGGYRLLSFDP